ncbi:NAD(P)-binding domain-containing protein [Actinospica sp.]|uniref:NAD(P)-binding domain-containing protein n=1 Tax=Actinospica sp. TaxID=1872142 RepID=UPI0032C241B7
MAAHLVADGHDVTVWNRTRSATVPLTDLGALAAATASDAVDGAEVVITALFGPDAVREVVVDAGLPIAHGALWIDVTTISPADATSFDTWAQAQGVAYVHAPVIGSLPPARARSWAFSSAAPRRRWPEPGRSPCGPTRPKSRPTSHRRRPRWPSSSRT